MALTLFVKSGVYHGLHIKRPPLFTAPLRQFNKPYHLPRFFDLDSHITLPCHSRRQVCIDGFIRCVGCRLQCRIAFTFKSRINGNCKDTCGVSATMNGDIRMLILYARKRGYNTVMVFLFDAETRVSRPLAGGKVCFLRIFVILLEHDVSKPLILLGMGTQGMPSCKNHPHP